MEDSLYDEFGNYIGPDPTGDEDDHDESDDDERWMDELRPADQEGASANGHMEVAGTYLVHGGPGYHSRSLLYSVTPPLRDIARSIATNQHHSLTRSTDDLDHPSSAIVLHEDKKYFPSASEVYPGAETLVEDEDTQALTEPVIAPKESVPPPYPRLWFA